MGTQKYIVGIVSCVIFFAWGSYIEINDPCHCYMPGTRESVDGKSICNMTTLKCKCHRNVDESGLNCDRCKPGYYDILSGIGCKKCNCDRHGTIDPNNCNIVTGQCICKPGFTGYLCNQCQADLYRLDEKSCKTCNCNMFGSKHFQCDYDGQCSCLENITGLKCDRCTNNTYDITKGCIKCPECYTKVEIVMNNLEKNLEEVSTAITKALNNNPLTSLTLDYRKFKLALLDLQENINRLKGKSYSSIQNVDVTRIDKLLTKLNSIANKGTILKNKINLQAATKLLMNLGNELKTLHALTEIGKQAVDKAKSESQNVQRSNEQILKIKNYAVKFANYIERRVASFISIGLQTNKTCKEACGAAEDFREKHESLQEDIALFQTEMVDKNTGKKLQADATLLKSKAVHVKADAVQNKNLADKLPSKLEVPSNYDVEGRIEEVRGKLNDFDKKYKDINNKINNLKQQLSGEQNLDVENDKVREEIKKMGDYVNLVAMEMDEFFTAKQNILDEFNKGLDNAKQRAQEKLKDVNAIRKKIEGIQDLMKKIEVELTGVKEKQKDVNKAIEGLRENTSNNSMEINSLKINLDNIKMDLDTAIETANNQANLAKEYLKDSLIEMAQLKEQQRLLNDLKENLEESKRYIEVASSDVTVIYRKLIDLLKELTNFVNALPLSDKELQNVEQEMNAAEQNLKNDRKLKRKLEENNELFNVYSEEVGKLKKDVMVLKKISESLESLGNETYCVRVFEPKR